RSRLGDQARSSRQTVHKALTVAPSIAKDQPAPHLNSITRASQFLCGLDCTLSSIHLCRNGRRIRRSISRIDPQNPPSAVPSPSPPHTCGGEGLGEEVPFSIRVHEGMGDAPLPVPLPAGAGRG